MRRKTGQRKDGRFVAKAYGKAFYSHLSLEDAQSKRDAYRERVERGLDPERERVADYARDWLPVNKSKVTPKTYDGYLYFLRVIEAEIGDKALREVKPSDIKRIYSSRFADASASHIRHFKNLLTAIFDSAVEDGYCGFNPVRSKKAAPHKGTEGSHRAIEPWERELIRATKARLQPVAMAMLYAGLRDSEALALNVGRDVDFDSEVIHVRYFRHVDGNKVWISTEGKSPAAVRDVPLFPELAEVLKPIPGLLAYGKDGKVMTTSGWRSAWKVYINELEVALNGCRHRWYGKRDCDKIQPPPKWQSVTVRPYDLRHSFCTWCRDGGGTGAGVDMHVLQIWMGHSDISMIAKIYDHVSDERIEQEAKKLKNAKFGASEVQIGVQQIPEKPAEL